ncbi:MAG TPA: F0F1 ATP synthase subunit A, partial [Methylomirabilota bacterium]|nr:F0F1 ATP synthase subunit A [Methylomirabilota bacterium]
MSTRAKILLGAAVYIGSAALLLVIFGNDGKNEEFKPQDEFKLDAWLSIKVGGIDFSINRAVFYLVLASALTIFVMVWISRRMQQKPNRVQLMVELAYDLTRNNITGTNLDQRVATRWFPFLATLFFFIWFSNVIGYLPLPTNTHETVNVFGLELPTF